MAYELKSGMEKEPKTQKRKGVGMRELSWLTHWSGGQAFLLEWASS